MAGPAPGGIPDDTGFARVVAIDAGGAVHVQLTGPGGAPPVVLVRFDPPPALLGVSALMLGGVYLVPEVNMLRRSLRQMTTGGLE